MRVTNGTVHALDIVNIVQHTRAKQYFDGANLFDQF